MVQSGCTVRLHSQRGQAVLSGCAVTQYTQAVQSGCPVRLYGQAVQSGCAARLCSHAVQSRCPVGLHSQTRRFLQKMIDWGRPGGIWGRRPRISRKRQEAKTFAKSFVKCCVSDDFRPREPRYRFRGPGRGCAIRQSDCTVRLYSQAVQSGCTCTVKLYSQAKNSARGRRASQPAAQWKS